VQYQDYLSRTESPERYDCARKHKYHPQCLFSLESLEINVPDFKGQGRQTRTIRSKEDVWSYLEYARNLIPDHNYIEHLLNVSGINICPAPLIELDSIEIMRLYQFSKQGLYPIQGNYFEQPAAFIEACGIIASEENLLFKKATKRNGKRQTD
jgi:hypothetical protein